MKYKDKILKRIKDNVILQYKKLDKSDMMLGDLNWNRKCHLNSIQYIKENKAKESYLCVTIDNSDFMCVHFVNKNKDNKFVDNTWGWLYEQVDYYIIRKVNTDEYDNIWDLLDRTKRSLVFNNSNCILRKICGIKYEDII